MRALLLLAIAACAAAPAPRKPRPHKSPPPPTAVEEPITWIDDCPANFRADPKTNLRDGAKAEELAKRGDNQIEEVKAATDQTTYINAIRDVIDTYTRALKADNYNAQATFGLAVAYDKAFRKGCALQLIKRLSILETDFRGGRDARRFLDAIEADDSLFVHYRKDAIEAAGR